MLDKIDLTLSMPKPEYKLVMEELSERLKQVQQTLKELQIPVIIAFEGWSSAGKGTLISSLLYPLDPRYFNVYTMDKVSEDMDYRPYLWSYWIKTPAKGRMTIFDKSWHRIVQHDGSKWNIKKEESEHFYDDINSFERQLTDDGFVIIKLFLHIDKNEQKRRLKDLQKEESTKWRVDNEDWKQNTHYEETLKQFETMIINTSTTNCPWHIIEANDKRYAVVKIYKTIIARIEQEIKRQRQRLILKEEGIDANDYSVDNVSILSSVDLDKNFTKKEYKSKLYDLQLRMSTLVNIIYKKRKSVVIAYEGWDAAGKGGNIKRLTQEVDPRAYEVVPISAPTQEELNHHYLWRFWNKIPKDGHMSIFDRSWYGRVLVERAEKLCTPEEAVRAYREINEMERNITNHGTVILKFWLHIDKDEQLRRFEERQNDPLKNYKITSEDWRNREKWDLYEQLINEMLFRTNTSYAPWIIVESNSKMYARIKVLEQVVSALEKALKN